MKDLSNLVQEFLSEKSSKVSNDRLNEIINTIIELKWGDSVEPVLFRPVEKITKEHSHEEIINILRNAQGNANIANSLVNSIVRHL